jgi:hypothetical protein
MMNQAEGIALWPGIAIPCGIVPKSSTPSSIQFSILPSRLTQVCRRWLAQELNILTAFWPTRADIPQGRLFLRNCRPARHASPHDRATLTNHRSARPASPHVEAQNPGALGARAWVKAARHWLGCGGKGPENNPALLCRLFTGTETLVVNLDR